VGSVSPHKLSIKVSDQLVFSLVAYCMCGNVVCGADVSLVCTQKKKKKTLYVGAQ
jgi:hypothetical protein